MAYYDETPVKQSIISSIRILAHKLELHLQFDDPETIAYGDLIHLRDELMNQYNQKIFLSQGLKENVFK